MPDVSSIDIQPEIQWSMRPHLLDFLIEAHAASQLLPDTLFLAVNLLDRYCSRRVVYKCHYQLVGCAALRIAAKYSDKKDRVPPVRELRSMCCSLRDEEMFIQMEWHVLQTLGWQIGHPTVDSFLQIALEESGFRDQEAEHMTWYLCELAVFHKEFISVLPSVLARSALALSRCILARPPQQWDWAGRYDATVVLNLANYLSQPSQVLRRKYAFADKHCVAQTVEYFLQTQQHQQQNVVMETGPAVTFVQQNNYHGYDQAITRFGCLTPPVTPGEEHFTR
jgi:Cyclin, N-terminal domain/Cyclin, C-terminal domain